MPTKKQQNQSGCEVIMKFYQRRGSVAKPQRSFSTKFKYELWTIINESSVKASATVL